MVNVGVSVATSSWFLASADDRDALGVVDLIVAAADTRLALEQRQGAALVAAASDRAKAEQTEQAVLSAWRKWYHEALESVRRLSVSGPSKAIDDRVSQAQQKLSR
jgi:hypothetical protein